MKIDLPLDQMTAEEKVLLIETIWNSLSETPGGIPLTDHHRIILDERRRKLAEGTAEFVDWREAVEEIRQGKP